MNFEKIRNELLNEAKASPNLLSDLAGLEIYIAESYHNRSFIELLQNADDASATKFKIVKNGELLFVANNGRKFNQNDLESLCRSASSNKSRNESIGYRGIGFKSVVGFTNEIHIISDELEFTFSKNKTQSEIPNAKRVPLIRIPHLLTNEDKALIKPIQSSLQSEGYSTIFVFAGVISHEIESEFTSFDYNSLIFLRNVTETEITFESKVFVKIIKEKLSDSDVNLTFNSNGTISDWYISKYENSNIAFSIRNDKIIKLGQLESFVHVFLPTEDCNGLGVLINGDFSTEPSRRHLIIDDETIEAIKKCSRHIMQLLEKNLKIFSNKNYNIINALIPYSDPRMYNFKRYSFEKLLVEELKKQDSTFFKSMKLCPNWLNSTDFSLLINSTNINSRFFDLDGFISFAKYLGAREIELKDILTNVNECDLSFLGCVQLTKYIFKSIITFTGINEKEIIDLKILHCKGQRISLREYNSNSSQLDESFISLLLENGLTEFDIRQVLKKISPNAITNFKIPTAVIPNKDKTDLVKEWFSSSKETSNQQIKESIRRWRSAEETTLEILNLNGFKLEDVSKQNLGFDLCGLDPKGNEIQIEIKSITLPGQKFKMTNNEIAVAQEKQKSFFIALARQTQDSFEVALICDPINNLSFNRQCVQWIWECENYEYKPLKFGI